ncbi:uncharacterized protein DSM5745_04401 [Aspergillus mulundensis]|uniref:NAD(P)-binding domain-containing protein n=1 Tax=Aspergillus mulundensis TaxID=1810919 RepID=A0A3D8SCL3_9EURO|nr:Uncharacterized protein DSM5745_04401 [Aspergillus mulundensis]RDW84075.1 Uncharacterized protein DSM5745_04401 [Aspergillus mulundensis]
MVNVAVAGGTGGVGRTIVEVLAESHHEAFVFSRKPSTSQGKVTSLTVDYTNIPALVDVLEANKIHTVICAFAVAGDSLSTSQKNLIEAANLSSTTKRFVPSSFAIKYPETAVEILPQLKDYFDALETLRSSDLEFTVFHNGIFLDYFISPESGMKTYLKRNVFVLDIANKVAAIPGDGTSVVTFTYTFDLARFVVAALDLETWEEESCVAGDEMSWNDFVALAQEVLGVEFEIHYDSVEKLRSFKITELPGHVSLYERFPKKAFQWFMAAFELFTLGGGSRLERVGSLNGVFPGIRAVTVRDVLEGWK